MVVIGRRASPTRRTLSRREQKHRKRAGRAGLRVFRGKLDLDRMVVAGQPGCSEIVYGYRFPSYPGRIKIGYSSRGLERVVEQSTAFPETPEVLFVIHDPRARDIEKSLHIALAGQQADVMGSEWFDAGWSDLLRVSPILRRAVGQRRWREPARWLLTVPVVLGALALHPLWILLFTAISPSAPSTLWNVLGAYATAMSMLVQDGDLSYLRALLDWAGEVERHWSLHWAPVAVTGGLCALPWWRWSRQA